MNNCRSKILIIAACVVCSIAAIGQASKEGKLVVRVFVGDNNAPARDAFVYVRDHFGQSSAAVKPVRDGLFEIYLRPGLYDVFVGEGSSLPMCRRIEIKADRTRMYTAKLEADEDHLQNVQTP